MFQFPERIRYRFELVFLAMTSRTPWGIERLAVCALWGGHKRVLDI